MKQDDLQFDEYSRYITLKFQKKSLLQKISDKMHKVTLNNQEIIRMRNEIIRDLKPYFIDFHQKQANNEWFHQLIIDVFDERIRTLPSDMIIDLYEDYKAYKSAKSEKMKSIVLFELITFLNLSYSYEGWFRQKIQEFI